MATQLQIRRDTAADLTSVTPVEAEPGFDQTNKRLIVGDNARSQGIPHASFKDVQNQPFSFDVAAGTANAITLDLTDGTLDYNPTAYVAGQRFVFMASADNTGAVTVDVDGLGQKTIKKNAGADDLAAGDIVDGGIYSITYDGTYFQIGGGIGGASFPPASFTSSEQTVTVNSVLQVSHGLAVKPAMVRALLRCKTEDLDYAIGEEVQFMSAVSDSSSRGVSLFSDDTNVNIAIRGVGLPNADGSGLGGITASRWRWVVEAWK